MAFFKFRKGGGDDHAAPAPAAESIEAMRTRARHRLIGAAVLVVIGVIGFPLLFDNQPRPISVDIPIEIPDKNTVKPLTTASQAKPAAEIVETDAGKEHVSAASAPAPTPTPTPKPASAPVAPPAARPAPVVAAVTPAASSRASTGTVSSASQTAKPASKPASKPEAKPAEKPAEKPASKPAEKASDKPAAKPTPSTDDGAKAMALLEGKDTTQKPATTASNAATPNNAASATSGRYIVQVGAYADGVKAHDVRITLEKAGIKTYAQVVETKEGKRYRVRVGPFASKADADKTAEKIRKLDLPAAILEL